MIDMVERRAAFGEISALLPLGEGRLTLAEVELGPAAADDFGVQYPL
jgi:hypothetical protein